MNNPVLVMLIQNAVFLLAMVVVVDLISSRQQLRGKLMRQVLAGLIIGGLAVGLMMASFQLETGIIFDSRSVLLSVSGLFLGAIPTVFTMVITVAYRLWVGGTGAWTGTFVILSTGAVGIIWHHYRRGQLEDISVGELYGFGVVVHLVMLAMMLTLPWEASRRVFTGIGLPIMLVFPIATIVVGLLLANRFRRENTAAALAASEERSRLALHAAHMGTFDWDMTVNRIVWSRWHEELWGFKPGEFGGTCEALSTRVHPEDIPGLNAEIVRCIAGRSRMVREFRVVWSDGTIHWVAAVGEFEYDVVGQAVRMYGVVMETTERKRTEEQISGQLLELQRWKDVMLDREDRVLELKREVNELLTRTGHPPRYQSTTGEREMMDDE